MKRNLILLVTLLCSLIPLAAQESATAAPQVVIGYCHRQALIDSMPESAQANEKIAQLRNEYDLQYNNMLSDYNSKVKAYIEASKTMSDPIKMARQAEITELENRMNLYRQRYLAHVEEYTHQLFDPIESLVDATITRVCEENHITILFDQATPLYLSPACIDITPVVRQLLK